jgi:xanthine dehydrogenase/oxidase
VTQSVTELVSRVSFFLNGRPVTIPEPSPDLLLIDYLRSPGVDLIGAKKPCGQGGCGGCTVILSQWDERQNAPNHRAINACLRPVCALGGLSVTTVEGTGAARKPAPPRLHHAASASRRGAPIDAPMSPVVAAALERVQSKPEPVAQGMNPVAHRIAINNGSQCGYCSVGFVMNMSEFLVNHPDATKQQIEEACDGNLCRCTGYRSILTGLKTFASDWSAEDEKNRMKCLMDEDGAAQRPGPIGIPFPPAAKNSGQPVSSQSDRQAWRTPRTLAELAQTLHANRERTVRFVHGNTAFGLYPSEYPATDLFVDIRLIAELNAPVDWRGHDMIVSAGTSYTDLIALLQREMTRRMLGETTTLGALEIMTRRTGNRLVRNAASIGGNTMLTLKHLAAGTGAPLVSDLLTALVAADAEIGYFVLEPSGDLAPRTAMISSLVDAVLDDPSLADRIVLSSYGIPLGDESDTDTVLAQKVGLREVNAASVVNATTRLSFDAHGTVKRALLVFGGLAPYPWRAVETEAAMVGTELSLVQVGALLPILEEEAAGVLGRWASRMAELPASGIPKEYRTRLALSLLYKAIVNALNQADGAVPPEVSSSGELTWGHWPVSSGRQFYDTPAFRAPVGQPYVKSSAIYQTSGQLHYTHELPVPPLTVNGAFVQSRCALGCYRFVIPGSDEAVSAAALRAHLTEYAGAFVDLITAENLEHGGINLHGMGFDQPLFATEMVSYVGQSLALVLATSEQEAARIAEYVASECVAYAPVAGGPWSAPPWNAPILDLFAAIRVGSIFPDAPAAAPYLAHIWKVTRPGSLLDWTTDKDAVDRAIVRRDVVVGEAPCVVVEATQLSGAQAHFYLEPQACLAIPLDEGRMSVRPSTQSPREMHQTTAMALALQYHQVDVEVAPVGGGFGGKAEQTRFVTGATAVAAKATELPVRVALPREQDSAMIGKRHAVFAQYQIAVDRGELRAQDKGLIHGLQLKLWADGGAFYDCSFIVSDCIQLRADNAYRIANFESQIDVCRTNTAPNTAFRGFGAIQGVNMLENAIDDAALALDMPAEALRERNLYQLGDVTPYGQALSFCYLKDVWDYAKEISDFEATRAGVDEFNRNNRWRKRGVALIPVKYGSGYNWTELEQAVATIVVNQADGSVVVHQGGVEIGQGLATQARQVASQVLGVPMSVVFIENVRTSVTPNPSSTGASTGTPYSCEVVKQTCQQLRARLTEFAHQMRDANGDGWCKRQGVDFWNHGGGWADTVTAGGRTAMIWQFLVQLAYAQRVSLTESFTCPIGGGEVPIPALTYKPERLQPNPPGIERDHNAKIGGSVDSFIGFTYSAASSLVEVDVLTGETKVLRSDIVYDMGWSLNPAIDIGQVEGAFVQGLGYLTTEKLVLEPEGPAAGRLNSTNTASYKLPATATIPLELNTHLFPRSRASVPADPNQIMSAKEVGEPPLVLANSVFFAIKAAIRASRIERGLDGLFKFDAPATVEEVQRACDVSAADLADSADVHTISVTHAEHERHNH